MKVALDDRWTKRGGIGRFFQEIVRLRPDDIDLLPLGGHWPRHHPLTPLLLGRALARVECDVFWTPSYMPPATRSVPYVITIYDLTLLEFGGASRRLYFQSIIKPLAQRAARIVTLTRYSRDALRDWLAIDDERFLVVPPGVATGATPEGPCWSPGFPYVLYVGNHRRHKNLSLLIRGFAKARFGHDVRLVLTGRENSDLRREALALGIAGRLVFAGNPDDEQLFAIYRGARAVALVSLSEGFGLPLLEAMACGVPVVASNVSAMPEVVQDAGILVNPYDAEAIAEGLEQAVTDVPLRQTVIAKGLARSADFSWSRSAELLWTGVRGVAKHNRLRGLHE